MAADASEVRPLLLHDEENKISLVMGHHLVAPPLAGECRPEWREARRGHVKGGRQGGGKWREIKGSRKEEER